MTVSALSHRLPTPSPRGLIPMTTPAGHTSSHLLSGSGPTISTSQSDRLRPTRTHSRTHYMGSNVAECDSDTEGGVSGEAVGVGMRVGVSSQQRAGIIGSGGGTAEGLGGGGGHGRDSQDEPTKFRMRRMRIRQLEMDQIQEDLDALRMIRQLHDSTIIPHNSSVKAEFADLDGLSWSSPLFSPPQNRHRPKQVRFAEMSPTLFYQYPSQDVASLIDTITPKNSTFPPLTSPISSPTRHRLYQRSDTNETIRPTPPTAIRSPLVLDRPTLSSTPSTWSTTGNNGSPEPPNEDYTDFDERPPPALVGSTSSCPEYTAMPVSPDQIYVPPSFVRNNNKNSVLLGIGVTLEVVGVSGVGPDGLWDYADNSAIDVDIEEGSRPSRDIGRLHGPTLDPDSLSSGTNESGGFNTNSRPSVTGKRRGDMSTSQLQHQTTQNKVGARDDLPPVIRRCTTVQSPLRTLSVHSLPSPSVSRSLLSTLTASTSPSACSALYGGGRSRASNLSFAPAGRRGDLTHLGTVGLSS